MLSFPFGFYPGEIIRETVSYPRIKVTPANDSCLNPSMACEHILLCGHIIITAKPDEPCAPNCHHIKNRKSKFGKEVSAKNFYCDACIELRNEAFIPYYDVTPQTAEDVRAQMRQNVAKKCGKDTKYRKCYIGLKVTSVPCDYDGDPARGYVPREIHHPHDTALPQTGDNMFEDIDVDPAELSEQQKEGKGKTTNVVKILGSSITEENRSLGHGEANDTQLRTPDEEYFSGAFAPERPDELSLVPDKEESVETQNKFILHTISAAGNSTMPHAPSHPSHIAPRSVDDDSSPREPNAPRVGNTTPHNPFHLFSLAASLDISSSPRNLNVSFAGDTTISHVPDRFRPIAPRPVGPTSSPRELPVSRQSTLKRKKPAVEDPDDEAGVNEWSLPWASEYCTRKVKRSCF